MRGVTVELPEAAREKLAELNLQRDATLDSQHGTQGRLNSLPRDANPQMRQRLEGERDKHAERFRQLSMLVSRCNQFLVELRLPHGAVLELAPVPDIVLKRGETVVSAIESARHEIAQVHERLRVVKAAPLPTADVVEAAREFVARRALVAKPKIAVMRDALRLTWADDVVMSKTDVVSLLCAFAPEQVLSALTRELETGPVPVDPLPAAERVTRLAQLEETLLQLEHHEEALITKAQAEGTDVLRRPDASPMAVLGLTIAAPAQAVA
jgi:hypothetical protein